MRAHKVNIKIDLKIVPVALPISQTQESVGYSLVAAAVSLTKTPTFYSSPTAYSLHYSKSSFPKKTPASRPQVASQQYLNRRPLLVFSALLASCSRDRCDHLIATETATWY